MASGLVLLFWGPNIKKAISYFGIPFSSQRPGTAKPKHWSLLGIARTAATTATATSADLAGPNPTTLLLMLVLLPSQSLLSSMVVAARVVNSATS